MAVSYSLASLFGSPLHTSSSPYIVTDSLRLLQLRLSGDTCWRGTSVDRIRPANTVRLEMPFRKKNRRQSLPESPKTPPKDRKVQRKGSRKQSPPPATMTTTNAFLEYKAPNSLGSTALPADSVENIADPLLLTGECVVCLESFQVKALETVELKACSHMFHKECIEESFKHERRCPVCRARTGRLQGKSPSGDMVVTGVPKRCPGFAPARTIKIEYSMPSGIQSSYHPNPNDRFHGTARIAYLPDNEEGRGLLARLKYAWKHGLTFAVGTSLTTGRENCVVWTSIHHKTNLDGGPHSFPDPGYLPNCNEELSSLGVPDADTCLSEILGIPSEVSMRYVLTDVISYRAPSSIRNTSGESVTQKVTNPLLIRGDCCICMNRLKAPIEPRPAVRITSCSHAFHKDCLKARFKKASSCPRCRVLVKEPQGKSPSGTMKAESIPTPCPGFRSTTMTIEITYVVPEGKQRSYHDNPGAKFGYTRRKAYLPDNTEGKRLLSRLKYAFMRGLIFSVGTSQTTGKASSVVWSTICHKTSLDGGTFGFPDTGFIFNCNDSLDALGVPDAASLKGGV